MGHLGYFHQSFLGHDPQSSALAFEKPKRVPNFNVQARLLHEVSQVLLMTSLWLPSLRDPGLLLFFLREKLQTKWPGKISPEAKNRQAGGNPLPNLAGSGLAGLGSNLQDTPMPTICSHQRFPSTWLTMGKEGGSKPDFGKICPPGLLFIGKGQLFMRTTVASRIRWQGGLQRDDHLSSPQLSSNPVTAE